MQIRNGWLLNDKIPSTPYDRSDLKDHLLFPPCTLLILVFDVDLIKADPRK